MRTFFVQLASAQSLSLHSQLLVCPALSLSLPRRFPLRLSQRFREDRTSFSAQFGER